MGSCTSQSEQSVVQSLPQPPHPEPQHELEPEHFYEEFNYELTNHNVFLQNKSIKPQILSEDFTNTILHKTKFIIQDIAEATYQKTIFKTNDHKVQIPQEKQEKNLQSDHFQSIINQFQHFENYTQSIEVLKQQCEIEKRNFNENQVKYLSKPIGSGSQGSVTMNLLELKSDGKEKNGERRLIPIATKKCNDMEQFMRESVVLLKINKNIGPILSFIACQKQEINMELCICTLTKFKEYIHSNSLVSDELLCQILFNLFDKVQDLLQQGIFHGDIKPDNIAVALRNGQIDFIFIDYGASSWERKDYLNCYTRGYYDKKIFDLVVNDNVLSEDQIRHAEFYCVCRTIQNLMLLNYKQEIFTIERIDQFIQQFQNQYPTTIKMIKVILQNQFDCQMSKSRFETYKKQHNSILSKTLKIDIKNLFESISLLSDIDD